MIPCISAQGKSNIHDLLLLMYVVTEGSELQDDYRELDEDCIPSEERVKDHWWALNGMLADCGMAPLDLRNASGLAKM